MHQIHEFMERLPYVGIQSDNIIEDLPEEFEMPVSLRKGTLDDVL